MPKLETSITGAAGEHLVMSRLLMNGFVAGLAPTGVKRVDIVAHDGDGRALDIQVKSRGGEAANGPASASIKWTMNKKHEEWFSDHLYYCFVDFAPEQPEVFVLPSRVVARALARSHELYVAVPTRSGKPRKSDGTFRFIRSEMRGQEEGWLEQYRERWDILRAAERGAA